MAEMNEGCPRLKMGYESCDAPLCDCPRAARTLSISLDQDLGLVVKVARAIYDDCPSCEPWGLLGGAIQSRYYRYARAALLAIRQEVEEVPYCGIVVVPEGD